MDLLSWVSLIACFGAWVLSLKGCTAPLIRHSFRAAYTASIDGTCPAGYSMILDQAECEAVAKHDQQELDAIDCTRCSSRRLDGQRPAEEILTCVKDPSSKCVFFSAAAGFEFVCKRDTEIEYECVSQQGCAFTGYSEGTDYIIKSGDQNLKECQELCTRDPSCTGVELHNTECSMWFFNKCEVAKLDANPGWGSPSDAENLHQCSKIVHVLDYTAMGCQAEDCWDGPCPVIASGPYRQVAETLPSSCGSAGCSSDVCCSDV